LLLSLGGGVRVSELRFDNVTVRYGTGRHAHVAAESVDLVVPSGRVVGLVGESGSGKSTLARAAVGLVAPAAGAVLLDGKPVPRRGRRPLQMVFQDPYASLDPRMTAGESIAEAMPRGSRGAVADGDAATGQGAAGERADASEARVIAGRAARRREAERLTELVGLPPGTVDRLPGELSGGQRQRVALARALAGQPDVIIADEITSALDVSTQGAVLNLVRELQRELRLSMLFISHNLAVVRYVADFVAVMYQGRIVEHGPAEAVLGSPAHAYTRKLLAAVPVPGSRIDGTELTGDGGLADTGGLTDDEGTGRRDAPVVT
jgi:peptide/nickel transport system ATP-binding protein